MTALNSDGDEVSIPEENVRRLIADGRFIAIRPVDGPPSTTESESSLDWRQQEQDVTPFFVTPLPEYAVAMSLNDGIKKRNEHGDIAFPSSNSPVFAAR